MNNGQLHFILLFLVVLIPSHAKTIFVDDNASVGGDGTSWASAHKYLQDALAVAEYGDEIWVAEGTYKPDQGAGKTTGDRATPFVLVNGVGMYGGFLGTESSRYPLGDNNQTILSGEIDSNSSLWSLNVVSGLDLDANTTLDGFRIIKGNANGNDDYGYGGGIHLKNSSLTLINCVFASNSARMGGGLNNSNSSPTLINCVFVSNSASRFGGGLNNSNSSPTLINCVFVSNSASSNGGGLRNRTGKPVLTNCVFMENFADNGGGGMWNSDSATLTNCVFSGNSANGNGGGMGNGDGGYASSATLTNCVFSGNSANGNGGGLVSWGHDTTVLVNCIFMGNSAIPTKWHSGIGGGIFIESHRTTFLTNSILWKNRSDVEEGHGFASGRIGSWTTILLETSVAPDFPGDPNARDAVYEPNLNILQGWDGDARAFDADPLFVNIDNPIGPDGIWFTDDDGLRVIAGSPAIDAGYNDTLPADTSDLDNDGNLTEPIPYDALRRSRVIGSSVDIGPYEFDPDNPPPVVQNLLSLSTTTGGTVTGGGYYEKGVSTKIEALPSSGYLFSSWSGDASGSTNPLSITMDSDKTITANFIQDLNDDDGDGLTNFAEIVTHGTNPNNSDTDSDGLIDGLEIEYGANPNNSDVGLLNLVRDNPSVLSSTTSSAYNDLLSGRDTNATPYTPSWFYTPKRGWMWSKKGTYPYFFDANSSNWMYFQSGHETPRFYHYGTKQWMNME